MLSETHACCTPRFGGLRGAVVPKRRHFWRLLQYRLRRHDVCRGEVPNPTQPIPALARHTFYDEQPLDSDRFRKIVHDDGIRSGARRQRGSRGPWINPKNMLGDFRAGRPGNFSEFGGRFDSFRVDEDRAELKVPAARLRPPLLGNRTLGGESPA